MLSGLPQFSGSVAILRTEGNSWKCSGCLQHQSHDFQGNASVQGKILLTPEAYAFLPTAVRGAVIWLVFSYIFDFI